MTARDPLDERRVFDTCIYIDLHMCMLPKLVRRPQRCSLPISALGANFPSLSAARERLSHCLDDSVERHRSQHAPEPELTHH